MYIGVLTLLVPGKRGMMEREVEGIMRGIIRASTLNIHSMMEEGGRFPERRRPLNLGRI
jgi:hypothetical protein